MRAIPPRVEADIRRSIERIARQIVGQMERINPLPGDIKIGWTWGRPPRGAVVLARSGPPRPGQRLQATIYATATTSRFPAGAGFPIVARWFESGTVPRYQRRSGRYTGRIVAQPYFFPVFRAERRRARSAITRAVRRAIRDS